MNLAGLLESQGMTENIRYIEDSINQQRDKVTILRLMCLLSLVKDGLNPETYESLKTSFLQVRQSICDDLFMPNSYVITVKYSVQSRDRWYCQCSICI